MSSPLPKPPRRLPKAHKRLRWHVSENPMKELRREADRLCGLIVRSRGGCEYAPCGARTDLQWAHIFTRGYHKIRWDEDAALCLCRRHHCFFTYRPLAWLEWLSEKLGPAKLDELRFRAQVGPKADRHFISLRIVALRARCRELGI